MLTEEQNATISVGLEAIGDIMKEEEEKARRHAALLRASRDATDYCLDKFKNDPEGFHQWLKGYTATLEESREETQRAYGKWAGAHALLKAVNNLMGENK